MFSIITPTYKRSEKLVRAISSLEKQTFPDWEMIIVNDSPEDTSYQDAASYQRDCRITYVVNTHNMGVNYSRNRALDLIAPKSQWVIFLDDDDWFAPETLETFVSLIKKRRDVTWFVTNRAYENGKSLTRFPKSNSFYSYAWSYLISKRCKGDATHCIAKDTIGSSRFSQSVKQGEEWFFFYQIGMKTKMFYHNHNSTLTDGYNAENGLNFRNRTFKERCDVLSKLNNESLEKKIFYTPLFILYIILRYGRLLLSSKK